MRHLRTGWIVVVLALGGGGSSDAAELDDLAWLEGTWQRESSRGPIYERWVRLSDSTWEGDSWREQATDGQQRPLESLLLAEMGGELFYIPKVAENPLPVPFKLTSLADGRAVFDNPQHDFPQRIVYERKSETAMTVRIEGPGEGNATRGIDFEFTRTGGTASNSR